MHRDTNSSEWYINREKVRMKDVEELVRDKLKVQLDNLCQVRARPALPPRFWLSMSWVGGVVMYEGHGGLQWRVGHNGEEARAGLGWEVVFVCACV